MLVCGWKRGVRTWTGFQPMRGRKVSPGFGQQGDRWLANVAGLYRPRHVDAERIAARGRKQNADLSRVAPGVQAPHREKKAGRARRLLQGPTPGSRFQNNHRGCRRTAAPTCVVGPNCPNKPLLARHSFAEHSTENRGGLPQDGGLTNWKLEAEAPQPSSWVGVDGRRVGPPKVFSAVGVGCDQPVAQSSASLCCVPVQTRPLLRVPKRAATSRVTAHRLHHCQAASRVATANLWSVGLPRESAGGPLPWSGRGRHHPRGPRGSVAPDSASPDPHDVFRNRISTRQLRHRLSVAASAGALHGGSGAQGGRR